MSTNQTSCSTENNGFTAQQWVLLVFSFLLGIAAVFTVDKVFLADTASSGAVHAAVSQP